MLIFVKFQVKIGPKINVFFFTGIITIPKYGFYHIYSQIFFQHDEQELNPMLVHYVYLFRREEKWILMQSYVSKPEHTREGEVS